MKERKRGERKRGKREGKKRGKKREGGKIESERCLDEVHPLGVFHPLDFQTTRVPLGPHIRAGGERED